MNHPTQQEVDQIARRVRMRIEADEMYARERREVFGAKWQQWLFERIQEAIVRVYGWFDESLVEPVRNLLPKEWFN